VVPVSVWSGDKVRSEALGNDAVSTVHTGKGHIYITKTSGFSAEEMARIAKQLGITEAELTEYLKVLGENNIPTTKLDHSLQSIAKEGTTSFLEKLRASLGNEVNSTASGEGSISAVHTGTGNIYITKIKGIPPLQFARLAQQLGVTKVALKGFFGILERKQVSRENLDKTLREIAKRHKALLVKLDTLKAEDPEVKKLRQLAKTAIERVDYGQAEKFLAEAQALDDRSIESIDEEFEELLKSKSTRLQSAAATASLRGDTQYAQIAYLESAQHYKDAVGYIEKLIRLEKRIRQVASRQSQVLLVTYLNSAGNRYQEAGLYPQAQPLLEKALFVREQLFDKDSIEIGLALNNLAELYNSKGEYEKALPLYERALLIRKKALGKDHPDVGTTLNNLAVLYKSMEAYEKALPMYERMLSIFFKRLGKQHPNTKIGMKKYFEALIGKHDGDPQAALTIFVPFMDQYLSREEIVTFFEEFEQQ